MILEFKDFNLCLVTDGSCLEFLDEDTYENINTEEDPVEFLMRLPDFLIECASNMEQFGTWMEEVKPKITDLLAKVSEHHKLFDEIYLNENEE